MSVNTTLAGLSQTASSNGPDGSVDPPSTLDDSTRYALSFIATLRDGKGFTTPVVLASAGTTDIGAQNAFGIEISGTTTITSFGTAYNGPRLLRFTGALTLTHNASTLILPGGVNMTTAANDTVIAMPKTTAGVADGWQIFAGPPIQASTTASGAVELATTAEVKTGTDTSRVPSVAAMQDGKLVVGTQQLTTSGTEWGYTGIPSWVKRITFEFVGFSTNGANNPLIQIGDSGGYETSGYLGSGIIAVSATALGGSNFTTGFGIASGAAGNILHGTVVLTLEDASTFTWVASGVLALSNTAAVLLVAGTKSLSAALDRIRATAGGDTGDGGSINITYE